MKRNSLFTLLTLVAITFSFYGCSQPPQEELTAAQSALSTADEVEADLYVADLYEAAQDSFAAAQAEMATQDAKGTFSRDYDRAEELLAYVQQAAAEATAQVDVRKEELRAANEELFLQVEQAITRTNELVAQAPRGKDGAIALVAIQGDATTATQMLSDARLAQEEGNFALAHDQAQAALDKANALISELEAAIAETQLAPRS